MPAAFPTRAVSPDSPATRIVPVTPDDATPLPFGPCRAVFVGTGGDLAVEDAEGGVATLVSGASQYHPVRVRRVLATGTTAARILAIY